MFENSAMMDFLQRAYCDGNEEAVIHSVANVCRLCEDGWEITHLCYANAGENIDLFNQCLLESHCFDELADIINMPPPTDDGAADDDDE